MAELEQPLVSVVVPLFNAAPYVGAAIDSVIDQAKALDMKQVHEDIAMQSRESGAT